MKSIKYYHSTICPRWRLSGVWLRQALRQFPEIEVEKIELLTNRDRARSDGVRSIPTFLADDRKLCGFLLTKKRIRMFLESLQATKPRPIPLDGSPLKSGRFKR